MAETKIISMNEIESKPVDWLWYPYIPLGKITIIQGDPGKGKTAMVLKLASILSKGDKLPIDKLEKREPINIIYQTAEDGLSDTIKPRLEANGADCTHIYIIDESDKPLSMLDIRLEDAIIRTNAKLVILDPIQAYLGAGVDMHRANEVRPIFKKVAEIAEKYNCAIILIGHMNKASMTKSTYRGLGTIDIQAAARSVLIIGRMEENGLRVMAQDKNSLEREGTSIGFKIKEDSSVEFLGEVNVSVEELLCGYTNNKIDVKSFITEVLSEGDFSSKKIENLAKENGIAERTLKKYKKQMNIKSIKTKDGWMWHKEEIE